MKKILTVTAIVALGFATFTSCKKKSSSPSSSMKATINGSSFSGNSIFTLTGTQLGIDGSANVTSATPDFPYITIAISNFNGSTGTYSIDSSAATVGIDSSSTSIILATTGSVVITSVSSTSISGTFSFKGINALSGSNDTVTVTNGTFTSLKQ